MHSLAAAMFKVPVVFVSGDKGICADAKALIPAITTVPVSQGIGPSTVSIAPRLAQKLIQEGARAALGGDRAACRLALPEKFALEITYDNPVEAYRASWYPGVTKTGPQTVSFQNPSYFEVLRAIRFVICSGGARAVGTARARQLHLAAEAERQHLGLASAPVEEGMAHLAVDIGAVAGVEQGGRIELRMQLDPALQHIDELLALMGAPARQVRELPRLDLHMERNHVLLAQLGGMDLVLVHIGREEQAGAAAGQSEAGGGAAGRRGYSAWRRNRGRSPGRS